MGEPRLSVRFKSRGRSGREWSATFALGCGRQNRLEALRLAWQMNAEIVSANTEPGQ